MLICADLICYSDTQPAPVHSLQIYFRKRSEWCLSLSAPPPPPFLSRLQQHHDVMLLHQLLTASCSFRNQVFSLGAETHTKMHHLFAVSAHKLELRGHCTHVDPHKDSKDRLQSRASQSGFTGPLSHMLTA